jgi:hypothetical protein
VDQHHQTQHQHQNQQTQHQQKLLIETPAMVFGDQTIGLTATTTRGIGEAYFQHHGTWPTDYDDDDDKNSTSKRVASYTATVTMRGEVRHPDTTHMLWSCICMLSCTHTCLPIRCVACPVYKCHRDGAWGLDHCGIAWILG